ncbi:MAG: YggS family pyridoxal phosphate enzyme [Candidatus Hydrogenedentota bacterium]
MSIEREILNRQLNQILESIENARVRSANRNKVTLVAVTKGEQAPRIQTLYDLGVRHFGENRVHVAEPKIASLSLRESVWHMIGNVQRRKARDVVALFDRIDAVDRLELAVALSERCEAAGERIPCLLEVNVSGETSKHGFPPEDLERAIDSIQSLPGIVVEGVMTMAPYSEDPERARPHFARLRCIADKLGLTRVSMGMSNDFVVAVEEGSTEVRIGSALFKGL